MSSTHGTASKASLEGFALSPQQTRIFRLEPQLASLHRMAELRLSLAHDCDLARLRESLRACCMRHEILRTRYEQLPGMSVPLQAVEPEPSLSWDEDPDTAAPSIVQVTLTKAEAGYDLLRLRVPTASADGASLLGLAAEWTATYAGFAPGEPPLQYADYAAWRDEVAAQQSSESPFWERARRERVDAAALPFRGSARRPSEPIAFDVLRLSLSPQLHARLEQAAGAESASPATLVLAAYAALLARHGEAEELTIDVGWEVRASDLTGAVGVFHEALPLTLSNLASRPFRELIAHAEERVASLVEAGEYVVHEDDTLAPFGFRYLPSVARTGSAAPFSVEDVAWVAAPHRLLLGYRATPELPSLTLHYDRALYDEAGARLLGDQLLALLDAGLAHPEQPVQRLSALSGAERTNVLGALAHGDPLSSEREHIYGELLACGDLASCFAGALARHAGRAGVSAHGRCLSYVELDASAGSLAAILARRLDRAPTHSARIGHFLPRDVEAVVALLAIVRTGAAYVPIDPEYPAARIAHMLDDCGAHLIVTTRALAERLPEIWQAAARLVLLDELPEAHGEAPPTAIAGDQTAYVIYTSGSTGMPRGVPISHAAALYSLAARIAYYPEPIECFLLLSSFAFDSSIAGLFSTLAQGGCLRVSSELEQKDPALLAHLVCTESVTDLLALPSLHQLLLERLGGRACALRATIVAGEACPPSLLEAHRRVLPEARLYNEYGATEASVWSTVGLLSPGSLARPVSIGRPIPHSSLYVLDGDGEPVARGQRGEIYVGGPGLSAGYLNRPELTAEKFIAVRGERLYRTGDYGYWDDRGELVFLGRADGQVKIRGYRIELGEIEAGLSQVTGVDRVVVLVDRRADGEPMLRGFVETSAPLDVRATRAALGKLLPAPMVPALLEALPELPRNANGKFDRKALLALDRRAERAPYEAPNTPEERALASVWEELLGVARIGRDDDFFALGGHSLLAVRLVHRIESTLGRALPVRSVFEQAKLRELAARIESSDAAQTAAFTSEGRRLLVPLRAAGSRPPLFCFDPTGMHLSMYESLVAALPDGQPAWGVSLEPFLQVAEPSFGDVVEQVAHAVHTSQQGPYQLVGWSLGGAFALAVAHVLERRGVEVAALVLLDAQPPVHLYAAGEPDPVDELAEYVDVDRRSALSQLADAERASLRTRLQQLSPTQRIVAAVEWAQARDLIRDRADPRAFLQRYALLRSAASYLHRLPAHALAAPTYVCWARATLAARGGPPLDYGRYTARAPRVTEVPGDHHAAVQSLEVQTWLNAILSKADQEQS